MKRDDKDNGQVELAKVGDKRPKYATVEYVDAKIEYVDAKIEHVNAKINEVKQEMLIFKQEVNNKFDTLSDLVMKIAKKVGV
ncbi:MAG: hypothetical protein LBF00_02400 [Mycoplasmataceae bacterium]|nr:hypothetical protein [Mycoplasmataceae bacterium]